MDRLSDDKEALEIIISKWVSEDWATRYISLNRGYYEDTLPIIARAAEDKRDMKWMEWIEQTFSEYVTETDEYLELKAELQKERK